MGGVKSRWGIIGWGKIKGGVKPRWGIIGWGIVGGTATLTMCHKQCLKVLFFDNECDRTELPVFWQGLGQGYWKILHTYITVGSNKKI